PTRALVSLVHVFSRFFYFFFFFQAEDGIRDDLVTGVQTCALPICVPIADADRNAWDKGSISGWIDESHRIARGTVYPLLPVAARSEERRVGKECRSRGQRHRRRKKTLDQEVRRQRQHAGRRGVKQA